MKNMLMILLAVSCITVMAGCTGNGNSLESGTNSEATSSAAAQAGQSANSVQAEQPNSMAYVEAGSSSDYIGEDAAKAAALEHAGLAETITTFIKAHLDREDGRIVYDVEFYSGTSEYDYEVDAFTGEIVSYDYDIEDRTVTSAPGADEEYISLEEAKAAALEKAGLTGEQVAFTETSFEYDDGMAVYKIDFFADGTEYEVEVNAVDGSIAGYEMESQFD